MLLPPDYIHNRYAVTCTYLILGICRVCSKMPCTHAASACNVTRSIIVIKTHVLRLVCFRLQLNQDVYNMLLSSTLARGI